MCSLQERHVHRDEFIVYRRIKRVAHSLLSHPWQRSQSPLRAHQRTVLGRVVVECPTRTDMAPEGQRTSEKCRCLHCFCVFPSFQIPTTLFAFSLPVFFSSPPISLRATLRVALSFTLTVFLCRLERKVHCSSVLRL